MDFESERQHETDYPSQMIVFVSDGTAQLATLAEWWKRLVAGVLDALIVGVPVVVLLFIVIALTSDPTRNGTESRTFHPSTPALVATYVSGLLTAFIYFGVLDGNDRGQTFGKRAMDIYTCDARTGKRIGFLRAYIRGLILLILFNSYFLPGVLDMLWPLWGRHRRALHDYVARSVVVEVRAHY
jgi:uncharacterized RDD family membrane protein YckC